MSEASSRQPNTMASWVEVAPVPLGARGARRPGTAAAPQTAMGAASERRVLVVAPEPFYEDRGTPIAVYNVLLALSQLHYQVDLVTFPVGRAVEIPGVRVIRTPNLLRLRHVPIGFSIRKLVLDASLALTTWSRLRRQRYACIHALEESAFWAAFLGRRLGVPVIYDMQSSLPEQLVKHRIFRGAPVQRMLRGCERWVLRHVNAVVSSAGLLRRVAAEAPNTIAREWHFPNTGAEPSAQSVSAVRRDLGLPEGARVVLYTGTFEPYQGLPLLLQALPKIVAGVPDAVLVLVGGQGDGAAAIREETERLGLSGVVRLVDRRPREQIPAYLAIADVLVSPRSYGDNLPLKVFEYLSAGRAIVATDVPAHRAVLDERLARLVPASPEALATAVVELLLDRRRADELAEAARAHAARHFGWHGFVQAVHSLYAAVAERDARAVA